MAATSAPDSARFHTAMSLKHEPLDDSPQAWWKPIIDGCVLLYGPPVCVLVPAAMPSM